MDAFDLDLATSLTYLFLQGATCSCERSMLAKFSTNTLDVHLQPGENQMNIKLATISVLAAAFVFVSDMAIAKSNQLTDDQVKQRIIDDSIASYQVPALAHSIRHGTEAHAAAAAPGAKREDIRLSATRRRSRRIW